MKSIDAAARILGDLACGKCSDILIIVPPFAGLDRPNLGVHLLQSIAKTKNIELAVLYANALLAQELSQDEYSAICYGPTTNLVGESVFSPAAFGDHHVNSHSQGHCDAGSFIRVAQKRDAISPERIIDLQFFIATWVDRLTELIATFPFSVVGSTSTFEQTCASFAFLRRIKSMSPRVTTIIGGANCEGRMGNAVAKLCPEIDFIFSGESEATFGKFLDYFNGGADKPPRVIYGIPTTNLDEVPTPDYTQFYRQLGISDCSSRNHESHNSSPWLTYESSRGCWWGQKHHCTFCGINGQGMGFRQKSPGRVLEELTLLLQKHPSKKVLMVDNIMPHDFFRTLLPSLAGDLPGLHIFYEQKANLDLDKVIALANAGVAIIQPGIEALSSSLLSLMRKGVGAVQNVKLLRYAASVGIVVTWNLLFGFPNDRSEWYSDTLSILPFLTHLSPPTGLFRLSVDRFSPYFDRASEFGVTNVQPIPAYYSVFPPHAEYHDLAYHFSASYESESLRNPQLIHELDIAIAKWRHVWETGSAPKFSISEIDPTTYIVLDTRGIVGNPEVEFLTRAQAEIILSGSSLEPNSDQFIQWALDRKYCLLIEDRLVALATAAPELLASIEQTTSHHRPSGVPKERVPIDRLVSISH